MSLSRAFWHDVLYFAVGFLALGVAFSMGLLDLASEYLSIDRI